MNTTDTPKVDLTTFFFSIFTNALYAMGEAKPPGGENVPPLDLGLAKQNIDLLELMEKKTKGNRTEQEDQLLQKLLFEIRMKYLEAQKKEQSISKK